MIGLIIKRSDSESENSLRSPGRNELKRIGNSLRGHESGPEILAMTRLSFFATGLVWLLSHPSLLSVYRYSFLCFIALRLEF